MDPNTKPPIQPAPQNSIPNDTVDDLPMNNNSFEDVTAPVTGIGSASVPGVVNPTSGTQPPAANPNPPAQGTQGLGGPAPTGLNPADNPPPPPQPSGISSLRAKLPWNNSDTETSKIATGQPSAFSAPEPVTSAALDENPQDDGMGATADFNKPVGVPIVPDSQQADLLDIKKDALKELSPLVEHIDQKPQERFKTLLDMIRASDDVTLVRPAYAAAQSIEDDKDRAQALLEIVKEVNYLTQTKDEAAPPPPPTNPSDNSPNMSL